MSLSPFDLAVIRSMTRDPSVEPVSVRQFSQCLTSILSCPSNNNNNNNNSHIPGRIFFKKACVKLLQALSPRNPDDKWRVTLHSFRVEQAFLNSTFFNDEFKVVCTRVCNEQGEEIMLQDADFSSLFYTVAEALEPPRFVEVAMFDYEKACLVIKHLAQFHTRAIRCAQPAPKEIWPRGGWWRTPIRPTVKFHMLRPTLLNLFAEFPEEFAPFLSSAKQSWEHDADMMAETKRNDLFCPIPTSPTASSSSQTPFFLLHGDAKSSNFFFDGNRVVAFDYQWVGWGKTGLGDLVYLLYGSLKMETLLAKNELLKEYWRALGVEVSPEVRKAEWAREFLDYFCTAVPYLLGELNKKRLHKNLTKHGFLSFEMYSSVLVAFVEEAWRSWEVFKELSPQ